MEWRLRSALLDRLDSEQSNYVVGNPDRGTQ